MNLQIVEASDTLTHIALAGQLDIAGVNAVENRFYFEATSRRKPVIVDMAGVEFLASLGIGMLVRVAQSLHRQGCRMVLLSPAPFIDQILRQTNIDQIIPIATSREAALSALDIHAPPPS